MVPVEAQACGTPVVALGAGGARETVRHGATGILAGESSVESFAAALDECRRTPFDRDAIRVNAEQFSRERFLQAFPAVVERAGAIGSRMAMGARHDAPLQPPAGRLLRHHRRAPQGRRVRAGLPPAFGTPSPT
jgi:hypothetical protein